MKARTLAFGFAADRILGDPTRLHPVAVFGRAAATVEGVSWRPSRTAGAVHAGVLVAAAALAARRLPAAAVLWAALGGRSLERAALAVADALDRDDLPAARGLIPALVGRDPDRLDAAGVARAAVESVAENTSDAVVGTLLWGAMAGRSGVAVHRAANTLDAMIGHRSPRYDRFGWAAARLDDALNWPAARVTVMLTAPRGFSEGRDHPSPNAGRVEAAFARALRIRLGGPLSYVGRQELRPVYDHGSEPGPADVRRAVRLARHVQLKALFLTMAVVAR